MAAGELKFHTGSCHCQAIQFTFQAPQIVDGLRCDCSICRRKSHMYTSFTVKPEHMHIDDPDQVLVEYRFGTGVACHHFCGRCGIFPFTRTRLNPGEYRVNLGCIEGVDPYGLPFTVYDGKSL